MAFTAGPYSGYSLFQLPNQPNATLQDILALGHVADGNTYGITIQELGELIGGDAIPNIAYNTNLVPLTIYNYGQYTNVPGLPNSSNTTALSNMFAAMLAAGTPPMLQGGMAWIPNFEYSINASGSGLVVPDQTIIQGLGNGGGATSQFNITPITGAGDTFLSIRGAHNDGGVYIRNIGFQWSSGTNVNDTCINLQIANARVQDCNFIDVPTALAFGANPTGSGGLGCSAERCMIRYGISRTVPNNATAIVMSGEQAQVHGPFIAFQNSISSGGPTGCVGIGIGGGQPGSEHQVIRGMHLSDWSYGVDFSNFNNVAALNAGAQIFTVADNEIDSYITAINLQCQTSATTFTTGYIYGNTLEKSQNSTNGAAILVIDPLLGSGGDNNNISGITFSHNNIYSNVTSGGNHTGIAQNNQYGVLVNGGQKLHFIGGTIGNCGNNAVNGGGTWSDGSANVCIGGNVATCTFSNVTLGPNYHGAGGGSTGAGASQYAVLVSAALTVGPVTFDTCDMSGYTGTGQQAVKVTGSVASGTFYVRNCNGYNDQDATILGGGTFTVGPVFAAFSATTTVTGGSPVNYYGPSYIIANAAGGGVTTVSINGHAAISYPANAVIFIWLNSPYDTVTFGTNAPVNAQWRGR